MAPVSRLAQQQCDQKSLDSENYKRTYIRDATKLLKADKFILGNRIFRNDHHIRRANKESKFEINRQTKLLRK